MAQNIELAVRRQVPRNPFERHSAPRRHAHYIGILAGCSTRRAVITAIYPGRTSGWVITRRFGHMYQWQSRKSWNEHTVILSLTSVYANAQPAAWQDFADRLPKDYDILILGQKGAGPGPLRDMFKGRNNAKRPDGSPGIQRYQIYEWDRETFQAGLQAYMVSKKFVNEIWHKIMWNNGADMVDAWIMGRMCGEKYGNKARAGGDDGIRKLNCYHATTFYDEEKLLQPQQWMSHFSTSGLGKREAEAIDRSEDDVRKLPLFARGRRRRRRRW